MKKLYLWAVLCTATTAFGMDQVSDEAYPPSPVRIQIQEDLQRLIAARSGSPEEPRSASSSPIPADPSQEEMGSPAAIESVIDFQKEFQKWIKTENLAAFRSFLQEHYDDAEEYMSDELVALALQKKEESQSEKSKEIYSVLYQYNLGRKNNFAGMEKINPFLDTFPNQTLIANIVAINNCGCGPISTSDLLPEVQPYIHTNFFQKKSVLNIVLRDLIKQQKVDEIIDIVQLLCQNNNCCLEDIISDKTIETAYQKMKAEQTEISEIIYGILNGEETNEVSLTNTDTTAESLDGCSQYLTGVRVTKKCKQAIIRSRLFDFIENSDIDGLNTFCDEFASQARLAKHITHDILNTAMETWNKISGLQGVVNSHIFSNAREVLFKLKQIAHNPAHVSYILSDEDENGHLYSELDLDERKIQTHLKEAFSFPTLQAIVGSVKADKILELLENQKKEKKQNEIDWVSPESSPSDGLREYLGSFKDTTSISD